MISIVIPVYRSDDPSFEIISTGLGDAGEIQEAIDAAREGGCKQLAILHRVSGYPAPAVDYLVEDCGDDDCWKIIGKFAQIDSEVW